MRDVREFDRVVGDEFTTTQRQSQSHDATRQKSSLPLGGLCVEPFGGSGATLMGAAVGASVILWRQERYVDTMARRWQEFSGKDAGEATGDTFMGWRSKRMTDDIDSGGRPSIELDQQQVQEVETLAAVLTQDQLADYFGFSSRTFAT